MTARVIYIFLGPPGAGKGSLSQLCVDKLGYLQLSAGNLCREHIEKATPIGQLISQAISNGQLAPDDLVCKMVVEWIENHWKYGNTIIVDGFPRTLLQAEFFEKIVAAMSDVSVQVVRLLVSDEQVIDRILSRLICRQIACQAVYSSKGDLCDDGSVCIRCGDVLVRRKDDSEQTIKERLRIYHRYEHELINFYKTKNKNIIEINGEQPILHIFEYFSKLNASQGSYA